MEKGKLGRFVQKYNLAGLVESVKWETKDNSLTTAFIATGGDPAVAVFEPLQAFSNSNSVMGLNADQSKKAVIVLHITFPCAIQG